MNTELDFEKLDGLIPAVVQNASDGEVLMVGFKGAGTEQVERALHAIFPEIRTLRLDADTTRHKGSPMT